jgi:hypothetical protein
MDDVFLERMKKHGQVKELIVKYWIGALTPEEKVTHCRCK